MLNFCRLRTIFRSLLTTRRLSGLTIVFLGLGICVFTWGLQYKLSLYYPPHSSHRRVSEAKLLSKNEQPRIAVDLPSENQAKSSLEDWPLNLSGLIQAWLAALAFGLSLLLKRKSLFKRQRPWLLAAEASLDAFFFRPPPISA